MGFETSLIEQIKKLSIKIAIFRRDIAIFYYSNLAKIHKFSPRT
jgi:hypothetical protein